MTPSECILGSILAFSLACGIANAADPPDAQMAAASQAIASAGRLEPQGPAADLLAQARSRYGQAADAFARRKYKDALRLADEARAIADQASARGRLINARTEVEEKAARNADLRRQLQMQPAGGQ
ncbi:MAG: hypothetical protein H7147_09300 [Frankiaceae bacterium]|nr:hypothetical protein [Arenimonas sp.]